MKRKIVKEGSPNILQTGKTLMTGNDIAEKNVVDNGSERLRKNG